MTAIVMPALRSDDPIGVLAALGVVELMTSELPCAPRLRWEGLGGAAILEADLGGIDDLAQRLSSVASLWYQEGRLAPPPQPGFLPAPLSTDARRERKVAGGPGEPLDPMRMTIQQALQRFARQREEELAGDRTGASWLAGLVNQLALERQEPRCELTPLYARTGQQNLHQLYAHYTAAVATRPPLVGEALASWRRVDGDSGANLDARALRDAADRPAGKAVNAAVPGATWLALMSAPFFRQVGDGHNPLAVAWRRIGRGGRPRRFVWPVWLPPLDRPAIEVVLSHPDVSLVADPAPPGGLGHAAATAAQGPSSIRRATSSTAAGRRLVALGVVAVCQADRRVLPNSDGPLQSAAVLWPQR